MLGSLQQAAAHGVPVYGECGGLMYLGQGLTDQRGVRHPLAGLLPTWSELHQQRVTLGYRVATARRPNLLMPRGAPVRGHEFHLSVLDTPPASRAAAYDIASADGRPLGCEGFVGGPSGNVLASYVHLHFGAKSRLAPAFVAACAGEGSP